MASAVILILVIALLPKLQAQSLTTVTLPNGKALKVHIAEMSVTVVKQCSPMHCEPDDHNCDGVLDAGCVGLTYDPCEYGSIHEAYWGAAFTGQCTSQCDPDALAVSPSICEVEQ